MAVAVLAAALVLASAAPVVAFERFGAPRAESTYGSGITFSVDLAGGAPDRLELLLRTPGDDGWFVVPVTPSTDRATHVWDTSTGYLTPNTPVTYRWRAVDGGAVTLSDEATIRHEDDRPGLDWQRAQLGEATVHWYGGAEAQARRFGELTAVGVARAEELLGTRLAGPVDVFVYATRDDFFGALGPGAREWTGAAAYSELRTIFMWLGGGSTAYLERAMVHEVTHIVFHDATDNPYHTPARWLNEGIATWAEESNADAERAIVELEAGGGGLFAFEAITEQFPLGERGGRLSYAQGTTMVDLIIERHGEEAIARIAAAYRDGASDAEALEAGTGVPAADLYADFFAEFGVEPPGPIVPEPILPSNVDRPPVGEIDRGGVSPGPRPTESPPDEQPVPAERPGAPLDGPAVVVILAAAAVVGLGAAWAMSRRGSRRAAR
jgi:hypothetical protein